MHPAIDAAIQLRNETNLTPDQIARVELKVNPLVLELTRKKAPHDGLEGKFSIYHAIAVALVEGSAGEKQFSHRAVRDPVVIDLRSKVVPVVDPAMKTDQVDMTIVLKDGQSVHKYIEHAIGSQEVSMSDQALEKKFADLANGIIPAQQARHVMDLCWAVENLTNAAEIAKAAASG
jgi:2-methylcitrate dehydratase PrpD